ncbi:MAG TPA: hypothetical protein PLQ93_08950 [Bacteroidia bacterium]|nr:hypothetical protein [Bacteroidia bacterium]
MTKKITLLAGILFGASSLLKSQDISNTPVSKVQVCEVNVLFGGGANFNQNSTIADFQKLAPQSKLLKEDFSNYQSSSFYGMGSNGMFSVMMGLRFAKADKSAYRGNPILRMGFSYITSNNFASSYYQEKTKRYDTLVSVSNGQIYYLDSTLTKTYNMNYRSEQLRLDLSLIYRTDHKARWQFYSGIGLNAGISLNASTNISYLPYNGVSNNGYYNYYPYPYPYQQGVQSTSETFRNASNFGVSAYVPLGIDFRMGKKRPFWQRTHLFFEMRPGVNVNSIPELGTFADGYFQSAFGIKVNWEELQ